MKGATDFKAILTMNGSCHSVREMFLAWPFMAHQLVLYYSYVLPLHEYEYGRMVEHSKRHMTSTLSGKAESAWPMLISSAFELFEQGKADLLGCAR